MRNDDRNFAGIEFDHAAHGVDAEALDELLDQRFVKKLAAQLVELGECVGRGFLLRKRAFRGEGRIAVNEPGNRAIDRDLPVAQPLRIAAAVLPLVVLQHDIVDAFQQSRRGADDFDRVHDMRLGKLVFLRGERVAFAQDGVRHLEHADVEEQSRESEQFQPLGRKLQKPAERDHVDRRVHRAIERRAAFLFDPVQQHHGVGVALDAAGHAADRVR